ELEIRELLKKYEFPGDAIPIIRGSAKQAMDGGGKDAKANEPILKLMDAVDSYIPTPDRPGDRPLLRAVADGVRSPGRGTGATGVVMGVVDGSVPAPGRAVEKPLLLAVEDVFSISGRGTVATGRMERGKVKVGDKVELVGLRETRETVVTGVEMFRKSMDEA